MLQALVITLREGLEAFLIVAISLSYLRKSGRHALTSAVHWGIAAAVAVSALGGYLLYHATNQEWLDGPLALVAAASVTWMVVHMWRAGRRMKGDIEGHLRTSTAKPGAAAFTGVFLFTLLMVSREGMETALLLMQLRQTLHLALGAVAGVAGAAGVAWLWSRYGHRVNLGLFFQVTAIFLFVFVVQLVIAGAHEMSEQHYLPYSDAIHQATESWGPDSAFGHLLTYLLVILPLGWLAGRALFSSRPVLQRPAGAAPVAPGVGVTPVTPAAHVARAAPVSQAAERL
ncbi:MAG TPA: FTR1 family protein [Vicinamibacterales bacterium]|jgi:high-affinity iron transporter|nr:FTR1 family protein [Vicinamibacterales bacterium]